MTHYFKENAKEVYEKLQGVKPATESDLKKLTEFIKGPLPLSLQVLLSTYNGSFLLKDNYQSLSVDQIFDAFEVNQVNGYWKKNYIPFASDDENNFLCLEYDNGKPNI